MKKNYYPLAIFGFLALMVCCIVASVILATKDPALEDTSYFSQKKIVDGQINEIIQKHNTFLKKCRFYLDIHQSALPNEAHQVLPPYLIKADHLVIQVPLSSILYLKPSCKNAKEFSIALFLEKINSNQERKALGVMKWEKGEFISPKITSLNAGRYKAIFEVKDSNEETFFFEKEIFIPQS